MELVLHLDHDCNLRCRYCYAGPKFSRRMSLEVARRAVDLALDFAGGGFGLTFFGGEPLLAPSLVREVSDYARQQCLQRRRPFLFRLVTNGTLLDADTVAWLVANRFDVQVSIDGTPAAHDRHRVFPDGSGSYAPAVAGLKRLLAAGADPLVLAVATPSNLDLLPESVAHLAGLGLRHVLVCDDATTRWDEAACALFEQQLRRVGDWYAGALKAGSSFSLEPLAGLIARQASGARATTCRFGDDLAVAPSGRIYPCTRLVRDDSDDAVCLGDVRTGIDRAKHAAMIAAARPVDEECAACEWEPRCNYSCACAAYTLAGRFGAVTPVFCWMQRCLMAEADRVGAMLAAEAPRTLQRCFGPG